MASRRPARIAATVTCTALALALAGLGAVWLADRGRSWEVPRAERALFDVVLDAPRVPARALIAINPHCPHCMRGLGRTRKSFPDGVVLLVDLDRPPTARLLGSLGVARVWWDRQGVWRHRWGHRIYGEVLRFDASGRYLGALPPAGGGAE